MMTSPPTHLFHPLPNPSPQNDNGLAISQLFKQGGPGTTVFLVPRTTYPLYSAIDFSHHSTNLATQGFPTFDSGNQAILETRGEKEAGAVKMFNLPRTTLKRVHLRGCRGWGATPPKEEEEKERLKKEGKLGWLEGGGALVWMGGPEAYESCVEGCRIEDPRGWTGLHLVDYAQKCQVLDNIVGPCGQQAPGGPWADGLSIAGKDSLIAGNTVFDATDGAIVVFCAPGSIVTRNTIIARERNLLGAINMVDDFPFDRNFEGTKVIGNLIKTEGAFIRLAIGCGPTCWSPWGPGHTLNYGGAVLDNYLGPGQFGYGIALSGARRFKVLGNRVLPSTRFAGSTHRFYPATVNAPPTAFLTQWCDRGRVQECEIQDDFVEGEAQWLIGIEPEMGDKLEYEAGQVKLDERGMSRAGEGGLALRDGRWEVTEHGELILRRVDKGQHLDQFGMGRYGEGKVMWTSGGGGKVQDPILEFRTDGALTLRSHGGTGETLWDPVSYLSRYLPAPPHVPNPSDPSPPETWVSRAKLILQAKKPYLQIKNHQGNLVFSSSYDWTNQDGWIMAQGQWLAIAPAEIRGYEDSSSSAPQSPNNGSPQIPPRPGHEGGNHSGGGGGGRFGRFVKDVSASLQERGVEMPSFVQQSFPNMSTPHDRPQPPSGGAPAVPPRPGGRPNSSATFLYFSPETCQLILHSSPAGPTSPDPQNTHWAVPSTPVSPPPKEGSFVSFQGDGNVVLYAGGGVPWASMTNGERCADRLVLKANGEEGGPAFELRAKDGSLIFTSKQ